MRGSAFPNYKKFVDRLILRFWNCEMFGLVLLTILPSTLWTGDVFPKIKARGFTRMFQWQEAANFEPDRPFHNFGASKSVLRRSLFTWTSSISWLWGSKIVKGSVGKEKTLTGYAFRRRKDGRKERYISLLRLKGRLWCLNRGKFPQKGRNSHFPKLYLAYFFGID